MPEEELNTERELSAVIEMWRARAAEIPDLVYADRTQPTRSLLVDATEGDETHGAFPTLRSLRDVDANSPMQLVGR